VELRNAGAYWHYTAPVRLGKDTRNLLVNTGSLLTWVIEEGFNCVVGAPSGGFSQEQVRRIDR